MNIKTTSTNLSSLVTTLFIFLSTLDASSSSPRATIENDERSRDAEEQAVLVGATMGKGMESVCTLNVARAKMK